MIRDFEEILLQIKKPHIKDYMVEAVKCYYAGSYRATIIISTIAGMHDLREKIKSLASSIKEIQTLDEEIDKKIGSESVYERYMIEQATSKSILSNAEYESIRTYLDLRNRCAHPNEYHATAEEARMVFTGYFDNIINKPSLLGPAYIKEIINRLEKHLFFPDHNLPTIKNVVKEELTKLHDSAVLPLTKKLISIIEDERNFSSVKCRNATSFLLGILSEEKSDEKKRQIGVNLGRLIQNENVYESVIEIVCYYPQVFNFINEVDKDRLLSYLKNSVENNIDEKELNVLHSLITVGDILHEEAKADLINVIRSNIEKSIRSDDNIGFDSIESLKKWVDKVVNLKVVDIDNAFFETLIMLIRDNTFNITNSAVDMLKSLDESFLNRITDEYLVKLFTALIYQARPGKFYGGFAARDLWDRGFKDFKQLYLKFIDNVTSDFDKYSIFYDGTMSIEGNRVLFEIIVDLKQPALIQTVLKFMEKKINLDPERSLDIHYESDLYYFKKFLEKKDNEIWNDAINVIDKILE